MRRKKLAAGLLSIALLGIGVPMNAFAAGDTEKLEQSKPDAESAAKDLRAAVGELVPMLEHGKIFGDEAKRAATAPNALPLLRRIAKDSDSLPKNPGSKFQWLAMLAYFGDDETTTQLKKDAAGTDESSSVEAAAALAVSDWWKAAHDAPAQQKTLAQLETLAKAHPKNDELAIALMTMSNSAASTPALHDEAGKIIVDNLNGPIATQIGSGIAAEQKLKALEGKPLVIAGKSLEGPNFTTADWKGKVILVDFWASWCGPCKEELPRVKKAYANFHAKGFEVLGVSCDQGVAPLKAYLEANPDMPWPQLFDSDKPGWHEIATGFGIHGIPTMFLIDKAGVVRSVTARENFEELIPKMLAEK